MRFQPLGCTPVRDSRCTFLEKRGLAQDYRIYIDLGFPWIHMIYTTLAFNAVSFARPWVLIASTVAAILNDSPMIWETLERRVGSPTVVSELLAPSTKALVPAARIESSIHSNVRAWTFSDLMLLWNGVEVTCVQVGSLVPTPSLGDCCMFPYRSDYIITLQIRRG